MVLLTKALFQHDCSAQLRDWARNSGAELHELGNLPANAATSGGILVTQDSDYLNFSTLRSDDRLSLLMPIRDEESEKDIATAIQFLGSQNPASSSVIRSNHKKDVFEREFRMLSSVERWGAIEALGDYIKSQPVFESLSEIGKTVASELLTNAFYNAPQDTAGRALQPKRSEVSEITPPSEVRFSFGDDGTHIWLSVTDPFGTFNRQKLLDHLLRCSQAAKMQVREGVGGAGIGLYMVYRWSSQLLFEFSPGQQTTVLVKLLKTKRMKVFESQRTIFEVVEVPFPRNHRSVA